MATDLEIAYAHLAGKQDRYDALWDYYDGNHPTVYNASRLREIFKDIDASFNENWSGTVVDTILDRIAIERFQMTGQGQAVDDLLNDLWRDTGLDLNAHDAHLCTLVTGEAFIICDVGDDGTPQAYYNDSRLVHVFYEAARPDVKSFAAKWWQEGYGPDYTTRLTLYYPDHFEYYWAKGAMAEVSSAKAFQPMEEESAPNEQGRLPVFHLRRERRAIISELQKIITPQAQLNKILADMMIAAEFGSFKQRYIISTISPGKLRNAPNEIWDIPAGDGESQPTSVGEFSATELRNYLDAIERSANVIATLSGIPRTLLFENGQVPSGESLRALEAPLVKKAKRYSARWEVTWRNVMQWLLAASGNGQVDATDIDAVWADPATTQEETDAATVKIYVESGMPLRTALRRQGWSDAELDQMAEDEAEDKASNASLLQAYMQEAEANASQQGAEHAPGELAQADQGQE